MFGDFDVVVVVCVIVVNKEFVLLFLFCLVTKSLTAVERKTNWNFSFSKPNAVHFGWEQCGIHWNWKSLSKQRQLSFHENNVIFGIEIFSRFLQLKQLKLPWNEWAREVFLCATPKPEKRETKNCHHIIRGNLVCSACCRMADCVLCDFECLMALNDNWIYFANLNDFTFEQCAKRMWNSLPLLRISWQESMSMASIRKIYYWFHAWRLLCSQVAFTTHESHTCDRKLSFCSHLECISLAKRNVGRTWYRDFHKRV